MQFRDLLTLVFITTIFWLLPVSLWALPQEYTSNPDDSTRLVYFLNRFEAIRFDKPDSAGIYADSALKLSRSLNLPEQELRAAYAKGTALFNQGRYTAMYELVRDALYRHQDKGYDLQNARLNQLLGVANASQGRYENGLEYFLKAKSAFDRMDDQDGSFQSLNNIGVSYLKIEAYEEALNIFLEVDSLRSLSASTISVPVNLGFIYYELGKLDKAEEQLNRVLSFDGQGFDRRSLALSHFKLGEIYRDRRDYDASVTSFRQSIDAYDEFDNDLEKVPSLTGLALTYLETGQLESAESQAVEALQLAESASSLPHQRDATEVLHQIYEEAGDYQQAYSYLLQFKTFSDSLLNDEVSKEIGKLEAEFEFQRREMEIRNAQREINAENERKLTTRQNWLYGTLLLSSLALMVAYFTHRTSSLRKKANHLLEQKNRKIQAQTSDLQNVNQVKNQLFTIIAHDLKGPLNSLYGFLTLHEMGSLTQEEIKRLMPELSSRFQHTTTLLNNLLNWSRSQLEGYQVEPEIVSLSQITAECVKVLEPRATKKHITVEEAIGANAQIYADQNMIHAVLLNLISNAIKFTPEGGEVRITGEYFEDTEQTCISVEDTGIGIESGKLETILQKDSFYTTHGTANEKGTGLGLMLCHEFIEKNGGRLQAESEPGKGSRFYFSLPANPV